jgi:hypothetical protein
MKVTHTDFGRSIATRLVGAAALAVIAAMPTAASAAEGHGGFHGGWHGGFHAGPRAEWHESHGDWHGPRLEGDGRLFDDHDWGLWRGGRWTHEIHDGIPGWWWVAGGIWYSYPEPVYPYPDPYAPPEAMDAAPQTLGANLPTPPKRWYHCGSPDGYYPYVATCPSGWQSVPAGAAQAPVAGAQAASSR